MALFSKAGGKLPGQRSKSLSAPGGVPTDAQQAGYVCADGRILECEDDYCAAVNCEGKHRCLQLKWTACSDLPVSVTQSPYLNEQ